MTPPPTGRDHPADRRNSAPAGQRARTPGALLDDGVGHHDHKPEQRVRHPPRAALPMGRSAPPERLEPARQVSTGHG
ncbi:hypothetical protein ACFPM3_26360 [Streptomyces coeruleoprunus]|uniref:Uncharacterized protein n=1 Tax=Streptomyces coeruleoprunus TaxID=285563 RepID=A0ABV9XMT7_9ACTN